MTWVKVFIGVKLDVYVTKEYENEITKWSKMWELVKIVANQFPLYINKKKFLGIRIKKGKLYEFKPDDQARFFARIEDNRIMIYHKEIKQKNSLKSSEYKLIYNAFDSLRG